MDLVRAKSSALHFFRNDLDPQKSVHCSQADFLASKGKERKVSARLDAGFSGGKKARPSRTTGTAWVFSGSLDAVE